ncbi:uncharacterized protein LY89DRAFT_658659 [Mollisia scopiformis]|uniref:CENP-V/GFA domain-containing protein n=1 Tax=Mollisia scopiformis TaxID=149040 RepID=A0A132B925_MOLSC|nr:uncharacterized protein LY89DRAFT_658659 [Mollisia scopiformis]KUJ08908.1 hypothetical protein LY89DRAFT_658659 [Mollisia scopiformis]
MTSQEPATSKPTRRPYHGSCHCGITKYFAYITLPPPMITAIPPTSTSTTRIRKCNCSTCHKMSFFHVRLLDSPNDFLLLSPLDPVTELKDYTCFDHRIHWYFCPNCAIRCFAFSGESEVVDIEIEGQGKKTVWKPKAEGWVEGGSGYLSINAATLEPNQEGLNLSEWTEKGWIAYLDMRGDEVARLGKPHDGGIY